jgi:hypothetical protein
MAHEAILLSIHGMGDTPDDFDVEFKNAIADQVGVSDWNRVYYDKIYYQDVLQDNQEVVFRQMRSRAEIDWVKLRKFMLYGFSDAAGLERRAQDANSPYQQVQKILLDTLDRAYDFVGGSLPVVIVAHSLGCQVVSNYLWDAQRTNGASAGVFKGSGPAGATAGSARDKFRRLRSLRYFFTTGCNIPIFVAGLAQNKIKAPKTSTAGYAIRWKNFYDEDDVLGWPMKPLSPDHRRAVYRDYEINANGGFLGTIAGSWNPISHTGYWTDRDMLKPLARDVRSLLP